MKKYLFGLSILASIGFSACNSSEQAQQENAKHTVHLKGNIQKAEDAQGAVVLLQVEPAGNLRDTIRVDANGKFDYELKDFEPGFYRLMVYNQLPVILAINNNDLEINVDAENSKVTGSPEVEVQQKINLLNQQITDSVAEIQMNYAEAANKKDQAGMQMAEAQFTNLQGQLNQQIKKIIEEAPVNLTTLNILKDVITYDTDPEFVDAQLARLNKKMPGLKIVKQFEMQLAATKKLAIGAEAPEVSLKDQEGKTIKLSSLRGQVVLLDFWASWCGPCRKESPSLVKAYKNFHDKGFEIYGISLDRNPEAWQKAMADDQLPGVQVIGMEDGKADVAGIYQITAIPASFLLDKEGKIIAKNLRGEELEKALEKAL